MYMVVNSDNPDFDNGEIPRGGLSDLQVHVLETLLNATSDMASSHAPITAMLLLTRLVEQGLVITPEALQMAVAEAVAMTEKLVDDLRESGELDV